MTDGEFLVRKFVLNSDAACAQLWDLLKQRHEFARHGHVLQVVVAKHKPDRSIEQNKRMWKAYLEPIAQQARVNKCAMRAEDWHLIMKAMFLPEVCARGIHKWMYKDNGERDLTMSTGDLSKEEFDTYLNEIGSYATTDLGVMLPANPKDIS